MGHYDDLHEADANAYALSIRNNLIDKTVENLNKMSNDELRVINQISMDVTCWMRVFQTITAVISMG